MSSQVPVDPAADLTTMQFHQHEQMVSTARINKDFKDRVLELCKTCKTPNQIVHHINNDGTWGLAGQRLKQQILGIRRRWLAATPAIQQNFSPPGHGSRAFMLAGSCASGPAEAHRSPAQVPMRRNERRFNRQSGFKTFGKNPREASRSSRVVSTARNHKPDRWQSR
jgi:hypothetical protein